MVQNLRFILVTRRDILTLHSRDTADDILDELVKMLESPDDEAVSGVSYRRRRGIC